MQGRLNKEEKNLADANYIVEKESDTVWRINMAGPEQSPFQGGMFVVKFQLTGFPFKAPVVTFETKIYHPNVQPDGAICADMLELGDKWAPVKTLIKSLMMVPNKESPMNPDAAKDFNENTWAAKAKKMTETYAK